MIGNLHQQRHSVGDRFPEGGSIEPDMEGRLRFSNESSKRRLRLILVICASLLLAAIGSHVTARLLGLRTTAIGYKLLAKGNQPFALAEGSSLMVDGLSWSRISKNINVGIENWFVAGSSPAEWDLLQEKAPATKLNFIVVSAYDLNEEFLCDFRAEVVPLMRTASDLWQSRAGWASSKRILSQYPLRYVRVLFPTVGRSDGVMVGAREKLSFLLRPWVTINSETGPSVAEGTGVTQEEPRTEKVTEWSKARMLRRLALMRSACQGKHSFQGPKNLAFSRMIERAQAKGPVVVAVLPVSPIYVSEFLTPEIKGQFEDSLSKIEQAFPKATWVHLEQLPELHSNEYFWDFVHMNASGQGIATDAFLSQLRRRGSPLTAQ